MNVRVSRNPREDVAPDIGEWTGCMMGNVEPTLSRINGRIRAAFTSMGTDVEIEFNDDEFAVLFDLVTNLDK